MAEIRPFRGVRYNQQKVKNLAKVICPPYDIIDPQLQDTLYNSSDYNFIRIEFNRETPTDNKQNNRYTRAAGNITSWIREGILQEDSIPAFYVHEHYFVCQGQSYHRQSLIACVRLEEWDKNIVRPHENIIPRAKSDRMSILHACRANTSPVLAMYRDPEKTISGLLAGQKNNAADIDFEDPWGERHQVWLINQPAIIQKLQHVITGQPLYIADGHHRYDSALTYRREMAAQTAAYTGEEGFNFVMTSLIDFADPGMVILPTHRLVAGISPEIMAKLKVQLEKYFEIRELSLSSPDIWLQVDALLTGMHPDMQEVRLAVSGLTPGSLSVLTLRDSEATCRLMPGSHGELYKKLDVSLVDHVILENLTGYDKDKENLTIAYSHDRADTISRVAKGEYQLAFILNPVRPEVIQAIADSRDRMPRKSTYFYPKSPAGLVFHKW